MDSLTIRDGDARLRTPAPRRFLQALVALGIALSTVVVAVVSGTGGASAAATPAPSCTFTPGVSALATAKPGDKVAVSCKNLTANHPYLEVELSLLVAIDPSARPLLTGQLESPSGVLGLITALPEINPFSENLLLSSSTGSVSTTYTIPTTQPTDPNAKCPPPTEQYNSGLIGCAIAMLDLTTGKPVTAGTFLFEAPGNLFPPNPTLAVSNSQPTRGQTVKISDAPGAKTYWYVATLDALGALLTGKNPPTSIPVTVKGVGKKADAHATVTPASYSNEVFTPPKLQGSFVAKRAGRYTLKVSLSASLLGFGLGNSATVKVKVKS